MRAEVAGLLVLLMRVEGVATRQLKRRVREGGGAAVEGLWGGWALTRKLVLNKLCYICLFTRGRYALALAHPKYGVHTSKNSEEFV